MLPPVYAVITGNIRDLVEFKLILARTCHLRAAKQIDKIVFSTWHGEIDSYPGLRQTLLQLGIALVEDALPPEPGMGHITFQHRATWNGAQHCPDGCLIVRLRTDKIFNDMFAALPKLMERLSQTLVPGQPLGTFPALLRGRVGTVGSGRWPFRGMQDLLICGRKEDLLELIGFGRYFDGGTFGNRFAAEERWFTHPFLRIPVIREYFAIGDPSNFFQAMLAVGGNIAGPAKPPEFIVKLFLTYVLIFHLFFRPVLTEPVGDLEDRIVTDPAERETLLDFVAERVRTILMVGRWEGALDKAALRARLDRLVADEWRLPTLTPENCRELEAFQAEFPRIGRMFGVPTHTAAPAAALEPDAVPAALAAVADAENGPKLDMPLEWLEQVSRGEHLHLAEAALRRAHAFWQGRGVARDQAQAIGWLTVAAGAWHPRSTLLFGLAMYHGVGMPANRKDASLHLMRATMMIPQTLVAPRLVVAYVREAGLGEYEKALLIEPMLQSRNAHAYYLIAALYESGAVVEADPAEVRRLYQKAADMGHASARRWIDRMTPQAKPPLLKRLWNWVTAR